MQHHIELKLPEQGGIELLPHPAYSPDLETSDYHLFRFIISSFHGNGPISTSLQLSIGLRFMTHFLQGRNFQNIKAVLGVTAWCCRSSRSLIGHISSKKLLQVRLTCKCWKSWFHVLMNENENEIYYQQVRAPPHFHANLRNFLDPLFRDGNDEEEFLQRSFLNFLI